tara:strand:+ start:391 stop:1233 length:843 start_codon:yes stop_codon:yes gene_type:complete
MFVKNLLLNNSVSLLFPHFLNLFMDFFCFCILIAKTKNKTMKKKITTLLLIAIAAFGYAQNTFGEIKGQIIDESEKEGIPGVHVYVKIGETKFGGTTDTEGKFKIKPLNPGTYTVNISYLGEIKSQTKDIMVKPNDVILLGVIPVNLTSVLDDVCITSYGGKKLIDPNETGVFTIGAQELKRSAVLRDISKLIQTAAPGVSTNENGDVYVRGARSDAVQYFIDGVKTSGISGIPGAAIQSLSVYTGGVPAQYGDVTGGVIIIETKSYFDLLREERARNYE